MIIIKKIFHFKYILTILIIVTCLTGTVYAAGSILASQITYKDTTVDKAIDDLYDKAEKLTNISRNICSYLDDESTVEAGKVGAKYECEVGTNIYNKFYILTINGNRVDLIMDRNIFNGTIDWKDAKKYFNDGQPGSTIKVNWNNVLNVTLPSAQAISDVARNDGWMISTKTSANWYCLATKIQDIQGSPYCNASNKYYWLFDYLSYCTSFGGVHDYVGETSYGYWTADSIPNENLAWSVANNGGLFGNYLIGTNYYGIRPVITVLISNLN